MDINTIGFKVCQHTNFNTFRVSCQTNFSYCAVCSGQHMTTDHQNSILRGEQPKYALACINCLVAGLTHTHKATDWLCPFFLKRNNKTNITSLLATIRTRHLEGFKNPFGLTKVRHASNSSNSYDSSTCGQLFKVKSGNYPTQFLVQAAIASTDHSDGSFKLASSGDSLFRHVPNITASQAVVATSSYIQEIPSNL